jgi:osmotically-inducible protein OsmY
MTTDTEIEQSVRSELHWTPHLQTTDVAVKVQDGVVTLTGFARDGCQSEEIEGIAKRATGVAAVANDLLVRTLGDAVYSDTDIATEVVRCLKQDLPTLVTSVKALVNAGHVTLEGTTEHRFLRDQAGQVVRRVKGVSSVCNNIEVKLRADPDEIKKRIEAAFRRIVKVDCQSVKVEARGCIVTLSGEVRSEVEKQEAQRTAAETAGVTEVRNHIVVKT